MRGATMYKINYDADTGNILGIYPDDIEYPSIPEPYIEVDRDTWKRVISGGKKVDINTKEIINITKTDAEIIDEIKSSKFAILRGYLSATDYKQNQYLDGRCTADEYAPIKAKRVAWTDAYHAIEQAKTVNAVNAITYPGLDE